MLKHKLKEILIKAVETYLVRAGDELAVDDLSHLGKAVEGFDYTSALALRLTKKLNEASGLEINSEQSGPSLKSWQAMDVANALTEEINAQSASLIKRLEVSSPGFINIEVSDQACDLLFKWLDERQASGSLSSLPKINSLALGEKWSNLIPFLREIQAASDAVCWDINSDQDRLVPHQEQCNLSAEHLSFFNFRRQLDSSSKEMTEFKKLVLSLDSCLEEGTDSNLEQLADNVYEYLASTAIFAKEVPIIQTRLWLYGLILQYIS